MANYLRETAINRALSTVPVGIVSLIGRLLGVSRPSHIAGFVIAVVVDSIDRVSRRRTSADVREKQFVGCAPFFTDSNASTAVMVKAWVIRVVTPLLQCRPAPEFWGDATLVGVPVSHVVRFGSYATDFSAQASAATRVSVAAFIAQAARWKHALSAAIAETAPCGESAFRPSALDYEEPTESHSLKIERFHRVHFSLGTR